MSVRAGPAAAPGTGRVLYSAVEIDAVIERMAREIAGRHVLLVDDVLDRGVTLSAVRHELERRGAAGIHAAALIAKAVDAAVERPAVDFVGADAPDVFLFGCGMDLGGRWRGLPAVYAVP